jgi:Na+/H+ antiporter NhaC
MPSLWTLLPPFLAIAIALWKREVILALLASMFCAEVILLDGNLIAAFPAMLERIVAVFADAGNTRILIFSLLIGGLIALVRESGGVSAFVLWLEQRGLASSVRKSSWLCVLVSVVLFIESTLSIFASALVSIGLFDKYKMSRARLAYFVDSTCPTIKTLIPLNAWGALLLGLLAPFALNSSAETLIRSIPLNLYSIITLIFVAYTASTGRVFGPMKDSESRVAAQIDTPVVASKKRFFILPMALLVAGMVGIMWWTGNGDILQGSSSKAVLWSVMLAILSAYILIRITGLKRHAELVKLSFKGMSDLLPMVTLVLLAIALGAALKELGTAKVITSIVGDFLPIWLVAPMIFIAGCFISFATGTSWGTFAIMMPIAMPFAFAFNISPEFILAAVIGGGVFGDHCSGISDTAILSSLASGCDHYEHVKTQLPYALVAAGLTIVFYIVGGMVFL